MKLVNIIREEIAQTRENRIPFSRFMELALYHSVEGYYMKSNQKLGKSGDFFTSAHVGDALGDVLTRHFLQLAPVSDEPWALIEMGCGDGRLMESMCNVLTDVNVDPTRIHLYLIETSPYHRELQQERLGRYPFSIKWVSRVTDIPSYSFSILFSNELVDAFPVHRVKRISNREIVEIYVTVDEDGQLIETLGPTSDPSIEKFLNRFNYKLEVGQAVEVNLNAQKWLQEMAHWLITGYIFTIDYGETTCELLQRRDGTIRFYRKHTMPQNPYNNVGEVDITSHVNFDTLEGWGLDVGLQPISLFTQSQFLLQSGVLDILSGENDPDPFSIEAKKKRAIQQLVHPDAMGEAFRVLVQRKEL